MKYPRLLFMIQQSVKNRSDLGLFAQATKVLANFETALYRAKSLKTLMFADSEINASNFAGAVVALFEALPKETQELSDLEMLISPASANSEIGEIIAQIEKCELFKNEKYANIQMAYKYETIAYEAGKYENNGVPIGDQFLAKVFKRAFLLD